MPSSAVFQSLLKKGKHEKEKGRNYCKEPSFLVWRWGGGGGGGGGVGGGGGGGGGGGRGSVWSVILNDST